jgi:hypothetical protein
VISRECLTCFLTKGGGWTSGWRKYLLAHNIKIIATTEAAILNEYAVSATGRNANSDSLLERIVAAPELRQCFVMIINDGVHLRKVVNLHNLSHYAARMGQAASEWDGNFFAFQGDLFTGGTNVQTVEVPSLLLEPLVDEVQRSYGADASQCARNTATR